MTEEQIVKYSVTDAAISEMSNMYMGLVITDLEDKEQFDAIHSARMVVRKKRIKVDKTRKDLKADALKWGRAVQDEANRIFALIEPIETHLKNEESKAEAEKQRIDQERIGGIKNTIDSWGKAFFGLNGIGTVNELNDIISKLEVIAITPDLYFEFTTDAFEKRDEILAAAKQALDVRERLDREEAERKAEAVILEVQRKQQEEREDKLKAEQDKLAEAQRKIDEEKAELESEKRAEKERRDREAFEIKAKQDAHEAAARKAEQAERDRIANEKAEAEESQREKDLLPDREKLLFFAYKIRELSAGNLSVESLVARTLFDNTVSDIMSVENLFRNGIENL